MSSPQPVSLTYNGLITQLCVLAAIPTTTVAGVVQGDVNFQNAIAQIINYAELRIQRDLDMLASLQVSTGVYNFTAGNNLLQISVNDFVTVQTMNLFGTGIPLLPSTKEFIQTMYPDATSQGTPKYFAPLGGDTATGGNTYNNFIVGPYPASAYMVSITGSARLPTLSQYNTTGAAGTNTTYISTNYPDLMIMASMVGLAAYQRDFGRASDDPQFAVTYESQYQGLLASAKAEEERKRFRGSAWTAEAPSTIATPTRG
jgi:hypothetical protein